MSDHEKPEDGDNSTASINDQPERPAKRPPLRVLSAEEYRRETGRSLIAFPMGNIAFSGPRKPYTPSVIRMENVHRRLLYHASSSQCDPLLPPAPPPRSAKERRMERHWDAMWDWALSNGATQFMRHQCDDEHPMMDVYAEEVRRLVRDIPRMPALIAQIEEDREAGRLSAEEQAYLELSPPDGDPPQTRDEENRGLANLRL